MKMVATNDLMPGMIMAKDTYSEAGLLIINAGEPVTEEAVEKLNSHKVDFVYIKDFKEVKEDAPKEPETAVKGEKESYNDKVKKSPAFRAFKEKFKEEAFELRKLYGNLISGTLTESIEESSRRIVNGLSSATGDTPVVDLVNNMRDSDEVTFAHAISASLMACELAKWLKFSKEHVELAGMCGLLYDVGKVTIPSSILNSPHKLTDEQYNIVKTHPQRGYDILSKHTDNVHILNSALQHHEKCDGSGYPKGLKENEIDPYAKLIAIVDTFDAITSQRLYRDNVSPFKVVEIYEYEGIQKYDPGYIMTFLEHITRNYIGNLCELSDGRVGKIIMVNKNALARPVVSVGDEFVDLSKEKDLTVAKLL